MDICTHTESTRSSRLRSFFLFVSSFKLCKAFLHINLKFKETNTREFYLLQPNTNTNKTYRRTQGRYYVKATTCAVFLVKLSSLSFIKKSFWHVLNKAANLRLFSKHLGKPFQRVLKIQLSSLPKVDVKYCENCLT